jgi:hypothetical protein
MFPGACFHLSGEIVIFLLGVYFIFSLAGDGGWEQFRRQKNPSYVTAAFSFGIYFLSVQNTKYTQDYTFQTTYRPMCI